MLDTLTSANWRDFGPRYVDTFAFFIHPGTQKKSLVFITNSNEAAVSFRTTPNGINHEVNRDSGVMFEFIQVDKSWVTGLSGTPYLLQRVPARQWRRGISRQNTNILAYQPQLGLEMKNVNFTTMLDVFGGGGKPSECTYAKVLSKHFLAVYGGPLLFYREPVGQVVGDASFATIQLPRDSLVTQEVSDVLRRTGLESNFKMEISDV